MRVKAKLFLLAVVGVFALASVAPEAGAQRYYSNDDEDADVAPPPQPRRRVRGPTVEDLGMEQCQKLCNTDTSPCDPPEFKRADGRCDGGVGGMR
jgi:hypothetical protein